MQIRKFLDDPIEVGIIAGMNKVMDEAEGIAEHCKDYTLRPMDFEFEADVDQVVMIIGERRYIMSDLAIAQYLKIAKINFGIGYIRQCFVNQKADLAVTNLIEWPLEPKEYFVRTYQNRVRSFLTGRYKDYSQVEFLDAINEELATGESVFAVSSYLMDENYMSIYMSERNSFYRDFHMGLVFQNSEVGTASVTIRASVITPKNSNFLLRRAGGVDLMRMRHLGRENFKQQVDEFVGLIPVMADDVQGKLERAEIKFIDVPTELVKAAKELKISKKRFNEIMTKFPPKATMSVLDFLTTLTDIGSGYDFLKEGIEEYAGDYLERV